MSKVRFLMFCAVSALLLAWASPAFAHQSGTTVKVTAGKPSEFHFTLSSSSVGAGSVTFSFTNKGALSHDFFVFENSDSGEVNVLYRREDGNYGILEPEK